MKMRLKRHYEQDYPSGESDTCAQSRLINHLPRHAAVDDEIGAGDETRPLAVEQPGDNLGDVFRLANAACRMLRMILAAERPVVLGCDPPGTDAIDPYLRTETDGQGVSQRQEATLARRI